MSAPDGDVVPPTPGSLARKLTELLEKKVDDKGRPLSLPVVSERIEQQVRAMYGHLPEKEIRRRLVSRTYLWELTSGRKDNPTLFALQALATYLEVPVGYLSADVTTEDEDARYLARTDLNLRARGLSPRALANIEAWIDHARELDGLNDRPVDDDTGRRARKRSGRAG
jgi:transcriptional regulator with XRE-family HTH domain